MVLKKNDKKVNECFCNTHNFSNNMKLLSSSIWITLTSTINYDTTSITLICITIVSSDHVVLCLKQSNQTCIGSLCRVWLTSTQMTKKIKHVKIVFLSRIFGDHQLLIQITQKKEGNIMCDRNMWNKDSWVNNSRGPLLCCQYQLDWGIFYYKIIH